MMDSELELAKLGVPVKTRHNEVAPGQYEIAPIFENSNVGSDHQQLTMQMLQRVARKYGLVCLLHEKPFAGVNGSGKHNNWSMGTDTGHNLMEPGDTPADNINFLFFCAAVIKAVDKHQGLLRASVANIGQDHRLGANEAPPAIISIFLGAELEKVFEAIASGEGDPHTPASVLGLGTPVLPPLPMHGGDRNRTSPFAFTGNKFEFRALGSSMSLAFPNTVLNTIVAEAIDELADQLEAKLGSGGDLAEAVTAVVKDAYTRGKRVIFGGDNYAEEWHAEAEQRGLKNLRTTPDALPEVLADADGRGVREVRGALAPRARVALRGVGRAVHDRARTSRPRPPRRSRARCCCRRRCATSRWSRRPAWTTLAGEARALVDEFADAIAELEEANLYPDGVEGLELAIYARDNQLTAHGARARAGRPAREGRGRRPLAAAEVLRDPVHQVAGEATAAALRSADGPRTRRRRGRAPGRSRRPRRPRAARSRARSCQAALAAAVTGDVITLNSSASPGGLCDQQFTLTAISGRSPARLHDLDAQGPRRHERRLRRQRPARARPDRG